MAKTVDCDATFWIRDHATSIFLPIATIRIIVCAVRLFIGSIGVVEVVIEMRLRGRNRRNHLGHHNASWIAFGRGHDCRCAGMVVLCN